MTKLLEGEVQDPQAQRISSMETEIRTLRRELADAERATERAKEDADQALSMLRRQLSPLYRALQAVFGELDAAGITDEPIRRDESEGAAAPKIAPIWTSWKQKMPGRPAQFIDILLEHGEMTGAQLRIAAKCGINTVYGTIAQLKTAGLINKNGGRFSLKPLS